MSLFSKLSKAIVTPTKKSLGEVDQLALLHKTWITVKSRLSNEGGDVSDALQTMSDVLVYEFNRSSQSTTGPCLEYLLKNDVLAQLVRQSELQGPVIRFFSDLVALSDERLIVQSSVHKPLSNLLKRSCVDGTSGVAEGEEDLVGLLCHLCSKIKSSPELLAIFFREAKRKNPSPSNAVRPTSPTPSSETSSIVSSTNRNRSTSEYDFPIFSYLLRFVHREGKTGDLSRAGLLFLIETATSPPPASTLGVSPGDDPYLTLAEFVLDSDFSDVLGAGLGALYGLLPTKLYVTDREAEEEGLGPAGMVLGGMGDVVPSPSEPGMRPAAGASTSTGSTEFRSALDLYLKLVEFTQDVVREARSNQASEEAPPALLLASNALASSILSSVRSIFLEAVLYPSILECSESDGSAVAVLTYLTSTLEVIEGETRMSDTFLDFLAAEDSEDAASSARIRSPPHKVRRKKVSDHRKSTALILLEGSRPSHSDVAYLTSVGRFTLRDLLTQSLDSKDGSTVTAALKLLVTLVTHHEPFATSLLEASSDATATEFRPVQSDVDSDASSIEFRYPGADDAGDDAGEAAFDTAHSPAEALERSVAELRDLLDLSRAIDRSSRRSLSSDPGYVKYLTDAQTLIASDACFSSPATSSALDRKRFMRGHRLDVSSSIVAALCRITSTFFSHSPDLNLALTDVLASLASCPHRSLSPWLLSRTAPKPGSDEGVFSVVTSLVQQVQLHREAIVDFDRYLVERRQGLMFVDNLADALIGEDDIRTIEHFATTPTTANSLVPHSPIHGSRSPLSNGSAGPFASHYRQTASITVTPKEATLPARALRTSSASTMSDDRTSSVSTPPSEPVDLSFTTSHPKVSQAPTTVSLSTLLDNVVVLEEAIKELVAIVQCRRSLGIDKIF